MTPDSCLEPCREAAQLCHKTSMTMINVLVQSALKGLQLRAVRAFKDNYIWIVHDDTHALIVDAGQADPVLHYLQKHALDLQAILITHHHADHVGGIQAIKQVYPNATVYGPARENIDRKSTRLNSSHVAISYAVFCLKKKKHT